MWPTGAKTKPHGTPSSDLGKYYRGFEPTRPAGYVGASVATRRKARYRKADHGNGDNKELCEHGYSREHFAEDRVGWIYRQRWA